MYTKVPVFEAGTLTLPIGPNHSIGLGKGGDKWIDLDDSRVTQLNTMQVNDAMTWVMYHPQSGLKSFVDAMRPTVVQKSKLPSNGVEPAVK